MSRAVAQKERALFHRPGPRPQRGRLLAVLIVAAALLAYIPAMRGGFFWDDYTHLVHNPLIEAQDGLRRIWLTTQAPEYLPLAFTTHWVEWRLWGGRPEGPHAVNVLLHAASAVLLWRVLKRLRVPGAWLAGLLFAVHPVAVASAGWIMERKNVLSMAFCAASLLAFLKFDEKAECRRLGNSEIGELPAGHGTPAVPGGKCKGEKSPEAADDARPNLPVSARRLVRRSFSEGGSLGEGGSQSPSFRSSPLPIYLLSVILFLLALLSKTSVVMLPVVLLLCAWWRRGRISRKDLLRTVPFFALSLALGLVTVWFQRHNAIHGEIVRPEGLASRVAAVGWIAWFYLFKLLLPAGLCVIYPRWNVDGSSALAFLPLLLLLGGMVFLWTRRKSWGCAPLFAFACFLMMLLPVLGFLDMAFMRLSLVADHLQYAAMIGVIALAAGILARACPELSRRAAASPALRGRMGALVAAGCVAVLAFLTWGRASMYRDDGALLWRDNLHKNPANPAAWVAWHHLGDICVRAQNYEGAIRNFDYVIALNPNYAEAYYNRANASYRLGRYDPALSDCDRAIALKINFAAAYNVRARIHYRMKEYGKALADMETYRKFGGRPEAAFLEALTRGASREE